MILECRITVGSTSFAKRVDPTVTLHSKITQNALKTPQIAPEVPKGMHLGHIFLLGLAKIVFLHTPPPQTQNLNWPKMYRGRGSTGIGNIPKKHLFSASLRQGLNVEE